MHRVGGLEKEDGSGNVSYDAENHDKMTRIRAAKIAGIANDIPLDRSRRRGRRRDPGAELGRHVGRVEGGGEPGARAAGTRSRTRTCAT